MAITNVQPKSGIDFAKTFGSLRNPGNSRQEQPKAQVWINIGYETGDPTYPFVSLPMGIPLDTMEELSVRGQNEEFNAFTEARNEFMRQIQKAAETLQPGESSIIGLEGGLAIQIRRVSTPATVPASANNRFLRDFDFTGVGAE